MTGRTKTQRERDNRRISQLYLQGELQADIAASLSLSQATVSRALKALQAEWLRSALIDINEAKARELAKIDALEVEYWSAWKRSQEDAEVENLEQIGKPQTVKNKETGQDEQQIVNAHLKKSTRREGQSGNPAFLEGVRKCIEMRCKIIGIEAPVKSEIEHKGEMVLRRVGIDMDQI
jgi:hypothetical protein